MNAENLNLETKLNLTEKQERFCQAYVLNGGNGSGAAREAGYDGNSTSIFTTLAFENLTKPDIVARIKELREAIGESFGVTAEEVIYGLREVRKRALQEEVGYDANGEPLQFESDLSAANRSIELLGKIRGIFIDRQELTGKDGGAIKTESADLTDEELLRRIEASRTRRERLSGSSDTAEGAQINQ